MHLYFIVIVWIQHALVLYRINDSEFFDLWRTDGRTDTDTGQLASIAARGLKKQPLQQRSGPVTCTNKLSNVDIRLGREK